MSIPVPSHLVEAFREDPDLERAWREQLDKHPALGITSWTSAQVDDLEREHGGHFDSCSECQDGVKFVHGFEDETLELGYCDKGLRSMNDYLDASVEYSWQADFPRQPGN